MEVVKMLRGIVRNVSRDLAEREDLLQEALLHLWRMEQQYPENTLSWHLQSCFFHLKNLSRKGRSLDSPKHQRRPKQYPSDEIESDADIPAPVPLDAVDSRQDVFSEVAAQDSWDLLASHLSTADQSILQQLAAGCGVRQIARLLGTSHTEVAKRRRRIALQARRLGLEPKGLFLSGAKRFSGDTQDHSLVHPLG